MNRATLKITALTATFLFCAAAAQAADTWPTVKTSAAPSDHGSVISWPCPGYPMPGQSLES